MKKVILGLIACSMLAKANEVSIKDFRELYESLKTSMNLDPAPSDALKTLYDSVYEILPPSGDVKEYNASMQWALTKLTAEFCRQRIKKDALLPSDARWLHKKVDFSHPPKAQTEMPFTLNEYADVFWQRAVKPDEEKILDDFAKGVANALPDNSTSLVPYLASLCAIIGTSTDAVVIH